MKNRKYIALICITAGIVLYGTISCQTRRLQAIHSIDGPYEVVQGEQYVFRFTNPKNPITGENAYRTRELVSDEFTTYSQDYVYLYYEDRETTEVLALDLKNNRTVQVDIPFSKQLTHLALKGNLSIIQAEKMNGLWHNMSHKGRKFLSDVTSPDRRYTVIISADWVTGTSYGIPGWWEPAHIIKEKHYGGTIYMELYDCATLKRMAVLKRQFHAVNIGPNARGWWDNRSRIFESYDALIHTSDIILLNPYAHRNEESGE